MVTNDRDKTVYEPKGHKPKSSKTTSKTSSTTKTSTAQKEQ